MKPYLALTATCLASIAGVAQAQDAPLKLMGGPAGSALQAAAGDIEKLAGNCGIALSAVESQGSLANLLAVKDQPDTPLAIVQNDFLEYLSTFAPDDPRIAEKIAGIGVVAQLFSQDVFVVARQDIQSLAALTGRKVAIGEAESGSFLTARVILDLVHAKPGEYVEAAPEPALAALKAGEVDAVFIVDSSQSKLLKEAGIATGEFHLLAMNDPVLAVAYPQATIPAGTFDFVPEDTIVVSVPSVMIAYDYAAQASGEAADAKCRAVAGVAAILDRQKEELIKLGLPIWSDLDAGLQNTDWTRTDCAEQGLQPDFQLTCQPPTP